MNTRPSRTPPRAMAAGLGLAVALGLAAAGCGGAPGDGPGRPWEIERLADGGTRVMGLQPGRSTMGEALALFGPKVEAGLFQSADGDLALESYYSSVDLKGITGKLILNLAVAGPRLEEMRRGSQEVERLRTGTLRYRLSAALSDELLGATVTAVTFVPATDLEEAVIIARFGEPAERRVDAAGVIHLLYPGDGLEVLVREDGRELFQYTHPTDFQGRAGPASPGA